MAPASAAGAQYVTERPAALEVPFFTHAHWSAHDPWLVHGVTGRSHDMSLFGGARSAEVLARWVALRVALDGNIIVHARQVHGARVLIHQSPGEGVLIAPDADGHATSRPQVLLAVSVADCIPVYLAAPDVRAVALLHAGWRGVAAGMIERGIETLATSFHAAPARMLVHFGPAICGNCYEVGPEVSAQLGVEPATHVDLRAAAAQRAAASGIAASNLSISTHCTRCDGSPFFSHRGGFAERQIGIIGIRA